MASWIYGQTGVKRPQVPSGDLAIRQAKWDTVGSSATARLGEIDQIIAGVMAKNEGPVPDAFQARMKGPSSSRHVVELLADASAQYAQAHGQASLVMATTVAAMDAAAAKAESTYATVLKLPLINGFAKVALLRQVIARAKSALEFVDQLGAAQITQVYAAVQFTLPPDAPLNLEMVDDPERGIVDPAIREMWEDLTDDERKAVLEQMVRDWAEANGVDPDSITIYWNDPDDPEDFQIGGVGQARPDGTVILNAQDYLDDPSLMHTAVHEVQHVVQFRAIEEYEAMSPAERDAIVAGSAADPFASYGATIEEVEEWKDNWDTGYISDPWDDYHSQPVEVDARDSGRNDGASMTPDEFEDVMERAGVE